MHERTEKRIAAQAAKTLTMMCVRNTFLEDLHAGISPVSKTGDYTDVKVIDGEGREIPWNDLSRLDDDEMKRLMKQIVNRVYTFFMRGEDPRYQAAIDRWRGPISRWDEPSRNWMTGFGMNQVNCQTKIPCLSRTKPGAVKSQAGRKTLRPHCQISSSGARHPGPYLPGHP